MTFLLSRSELGLTDGGIFTIGEVEPDWANVTSQEKLPLVGEPYWSIFMDKVVVNGTEFCGNGLLCVTLSSYPPILLSLFQFERVLRGWVPRRGLQQDNRSPRHRYFPRLHAGVLFRGHLRPSRELDAGRRVAGIVLTSL